jgi:hypothetical protein
MNVFTAAGDKVRNLGRGPQRSASKRKAAAEQVAITAATEATRTSFLDRQLADRAAMTREVQDRAVRHAAD